MTLLIFHFDISDKDDKDEQLENKELIYMALFVFHFDISGNDDKDEQEENK